MNTISIDSNLYIKLYAKLHKMSVEAVIEKGLNLLWRDFSHEKDVVDENAEFQRALAYVESITTKEGKPVPADINPMDVSVETKYV